MKNLIVSLFFCCLFACKGDNVAPQNELVGKWKLVSYCRSYGGSTCTGVVVPDNKYVFIEFSNSGKFNEYYKGTIPAEHAFLGCGGGKYELESGDVRIMAALMSSLRGMLVEIRSVSDMKLVLAYGDNSEYVFEKI